jgi:hypothetical protein
LRWLASSALVAAAALAGGPSCGARTGLPLADRDQIDGAEDFLSCPGLSVDSLRLGEVEQMDVLFVIDNSPSMADKQQLLKDAIPTLVRRLANPLCVHTEAAEIEIAVESVDTPCPDGYRREFDPIRDLHIGVITSSLGGHGGDLCAVIGSDSEGQNDHAYLLGLRPRGSSIPTYQDLGFLAWDPDAEHQPPGTGDIDGLESNFEDLVTTAGEKGCGFESTLEAFYRFLIDPAPPARIEVEGGRAIPRGVDESLLAQRKSFLRPDSLLAIIMLSDENDCSVIQGGLGWLIPSFNFEGRQLTMPRASSACASDPNGPCCRSCSLDETKPPAGCSKLADDPECKQGRTLTLTEDPLNLRCFNNRKRFGLELLYPTARYAVGLRSKQLCPDSRYLDADCGCRAAIERARQLGLPDPPCTPAETGEPVQNPLFSNLSGDAVFERDVSQVFLAGIVGVPWQDIATAESLANPDLLEYMRAAELALVDPALGYTRWDLVAGDVATHALPRDPFMLESVDERSGENPVTGDPIVGSSSLDPQANPINGHERSIVRRTDLQYACIFALQTPRDCATQTQGCDCRAETAAQNPLCQPPEGGPGGTTQYFAKAYPSIRQLDVLRRHGNNAVAASICPKRSAGEPDEVGFGYRPAVAGLIKRLRCANLDAEFDSDPASTGYGTVPCAIVAVSEASSAGCTCDGVGRVSARPDMDLAVRAMLQAHGRCGVNAGRDCSSYCLCEIPQTKSVARQSCQNDPAAAPLDPASGAPVNGWCYIDPESGFGAFELVEKCPAGNQRNVRLLGNAAPRNGEALFIACGESCAAK